MSTSPYLDGEDISLAERYDYLCKYIIIGESSTGKTALLNHFLSGSFKPSSHTIGVSFHSTLIKLPSARPVTSGRSATRVETETKTLKLQLWDTAGQERFRSVTRNYYRSAIGAVICFDLTRRSTFLSLDAWISDARTLAAPGLVCVLVGTKLDQADASREVSWEEAENYAKQNSLLFVECSSVTGENVSLPFNLLSRAILVAIEAGHIDPSIATSGVSFGERSLQRVSSWSHLRGNRRSSMLINCC